MCLLLSYRLLSEKGKVPNMNKLDSLQMRWKCEKFTDSIKKMDSMKLEKLTGDFSADELIKLASLSATKEYLWASSVKKQWKRPDIILHVTYIILVHRTIIFSTCITCSETSGRILKIIYKILCFIDLNIFTIWILKTIKKISEIFQESTLIKIWASHLGNRPHI